jgi:hypothetical protein
VTTQSESTQHNSQAELSANATHPLSLGFIAFTTSALVKSNVFNTNAQFLNQKSIFIHIHYKKLYQSTKKEYQYQLNQSLY